jgi:hypothetical protein
VSEIGVVIAAADRDEQTVADLLTSLRSLNAVGGGWTLHVSNLSRGNCTPPMQEAVARLGACLARTLLALATRATSEAEAWLVAPSGEVLESEESTMLCEVCELLGRLERNGSLRGHIASGLIDLVRAFTWPLTPHPGSLAAALLRWRDLTPCKIRATSRPPPRAVARLQATPSSSPGRSGQDLSKFGKKSKAKAIICVCLEVREFITRHTAYNKHDKGVFLQSDLRNALLLAYGWLRPRFMMKAHARGFETVSLLPVIFFFPFLFYDKNLEAYMRAVHECRIALLSYSFLFFSGRKTASHRTWTWAPYIHERRIALFFSSR